MAVSPLTRQSSSSNIIVKDLDSFTATERSALIDKIIKIEKKNFASSEVFDFASELKKKNTSMIVAIKDDSSSSELVGYLVYLRMKRLTLLHKICVVQQEREKGIGKCLIHFLQSIVNKGGCESIHLWVDEARKPARALYDSFGFQQIDQCLDYYGPGRTGLKMNLPID